MMYVDTQDFLFVKYLRDISFNVEDMMTQNGTFCKKSTLNAKKSMWQIKILKNNHTIGKSALISLKNN